MKLADFLADHPRPQAWTGPARGRLRPHTVFLGQGKNALEVAVATGESQPSATDVQWLWKKRQGRRPSPLLLVVLYDEKASVCGPIGEEPRVYDGIVATQAERLARQALAEPDRHAATRLLAAMLPETEQELPGIRNSWMFSAHALRTDVPLMSGWSGAGEDGRNSLDKRGKELIEALGFTIEKHDQSVSFLRAENVKRAVATFLDENETPEVDSQRFNGMSPVSYALAVADRENIPYVLLTRGPQIRLYSSATNVGAGRKGRTETFVEANLALLPEDRAGYLPMIFGAKALIESGTFQIILERSHDFASDLGTRLRERVYNEVVPRLADALGHRAPKRRRKQDDLDFLYQQTLFILFRLLFVAYAEDKELLPYHRNENYRRQALKTLARELGARQPDAAFDDKATSYWARVRQLWRAVNDGDADLGVPPYNGGLFSEDFEVSDVGAAVAELDLTNAEIGPALQGLLVDRGPDGVLGPVDFRSLSVREFGTIYEGLLESNLAVATEDLTLDKDETYTPVTRKNQMIKVVEGEVYLHDRSGSRKASGSYFTKPFAVDHLLRHALEPSLDHHLTRVKGYLDAGEEHKAADRFFDFRCADIAMGSGHFLVAAVDRVEARLSSFLAEHPIPGVQAELERLRGAARDALRKVGREIDADDLEDSQLLRRQVARRCIYGVDKNRIAVELARLALWIHTFVPGLPLSFLDHNLVWGDSLTGISGLDEALSILDPKYQPGTSTPSFYRDQMEEWLERAGSSLNKLARTIDATSKEIADARKAHAEALEAVQSARDLFDLLVAVRLGEAEPLFELDNSKIATHKDLIKAKRLASDIQALHFPVTFPEVFLRERPGFDCIVGNPPWQEAVVEELQFWNIRFPGLKTKPQNQQAAEIVRLRREREDLVPEYETELGQNEMLRRILKAGPYPGMGIGDPDVYKAFAWRFWQLCTAGGSIGVVLPRSAFTTKGSGDWRRVALKQSQADVVLCRNAGEWLFAGVNPGYSICLVRLLHVGASDSEAVTVKGPIRSLSSLNESERTNPVALSLAKLEQSDESLCVPDVSSQAEFELFEYLLMHPPLGDATRPDWRALPVTELHATNDSRFFKKLGEPVYNHRNIAHLHFDMGVEPFAYAEFDEVARALHERRMVASRRANSPFAEMPAEWVRDQDTLPTLHPRIAFRDVIHASNPRKVWAALVPARMMLTNKAPYFIFPRGGLLEQAYLLAMLSSSIADWFGHLRVVLNLNFFILNAIPVPLMDSHNDLVQRFVSVAATLATNSDGNVERWKQLRDEGGSSDDELTSELDALASLLYGLRDDQLPSIWTDTNPTRPSLENVSRFRDKWRS